MSAVIELELETPSFERVGADVGVVWLFRDERPLRGGAGLADWRLCGWLSWLVRSGRVRGEPGECILLPTGGRLRAPRLLVFGLGTKASLDPERLRAGAEDALSRCLALRARRVVLDLPPLGPTLEAEPAAHALLEAARGAAARSSETLGLRPHASPGRSMGLLAALARAARARPTTPGPAVHVVMPAPSRPAAPTTPLAEASPTRV